MLGKYFNYVFTAERIHLPLTMRVFISAVKISTRTRIVY